MATIGNWIVGVTLKFKSNTSTEIKLINAALKGLREGEIAQTQKAFGNLAKSIASDMVAATAAVSASEKKRQALFQEGMARGMARAPGPARGGARAGKGGSEAEKSPGQTAMGRAPSK